MSTSIAIKTPKKRVLIVEDECITALDLQHRLRQLGYQVDGVVTTGEEAIQQATMINPDVVLMDIQLAGLMNGIVAGANIHQNLQIPIVFFTAHTQKLYQHNFDHPVHYIEKPYRLANLHATIESALYNFTHP